MSFYICILQAGIGLYRLYPACISIHLSLCLLIWHRLSCRPHFWSRSVKGKLDIMSKKLLLERRPWSSYWTRQTLHVHTWQPTHHVFQLSPSSLVEFINTANYLLINATYLAPTTGMLINFMSTDFFTPSRGLEWRTSSRALQRRTSSRVLKSRTISYVCCSNEHHHVYWNEKHLSVSLTRARTHFSLTDMKPLHL